MSDTSTSQPLEQLSIETDNALADEKKALEDAKKICAGVFEALHQFSKFELLQYMHGLARNEKERFY